MEDKKEKCAIDGCGEKPTGGTIRKKLYCNYHFKKFVLTAPLVRDHKKVNRNAPCPCGSKKKFKNCCISPPTKHAHYYKNREKQAL